MLFRAKIALRSVCDITPQMLEKLGVCGLLLDIDNTLTTHDNPVPAAGVEAWVAGMQAAGISLCLVSNNHSPRVEPFAKRLGLDFVCEGKKPLTKGYREAVQKMDCPVKKWLLWEIRSSPMCWGQIYLVCPAFLSFPWKWRKRDSSDSSGEWKSHFCRKRYMKKTRS